MKVSIAALAVLAMGIGSGSGLTQERPLRPANERPQRPVERPGELPAINERAEGEAEASYLWPIVNELYQAYLHACIGYSETQTTMVLRCPDGSSIEVEMMCRRQGTGGTWPNCNYTQTCEQTNAATCPPVVTEPEN